MNWFLSDDGQRKALREIAAAPDRSAAIVGVAFLETDLRNAIEARLENNEDLLNKMFKPTGPLGPFETKANLGFLLKIYNAGILADLRDLAWIRNRFAHSREPIEFGSRDIRLKCESLRTVRADPYPTIPGRGLPDAMRTPPKMAADAKPRERFTLTIQLITIALWAASYDRIYSKEGAWKAVNHHGERPA